MKKKTILVLGILSAVSVGVYVFASRMYFRIGFPLDDAWIHQTYARNLAEYGEWSFIPGKPSGGSTGPFWSVLLSLGYFLRIPPFVWTFFWGWAALWGLSVLGVYAVKQRSSSSDRFAVWGGILLIFEWHLVWAAGSGMETLLFAGVVTLVLVWLTKQQDSFWSWFFLGSLIGFSVWLRPDGITLLGPAAFVIVLLSVNWRTKIRLISGLVLGFCILFLPYLEFNYQIAGSVWPNTFFAKQAEYASHREIPIIKRLLQQFTLPLTGAGVVLLPGFILTLVKSIKDKSWPMIAGMIWLIGYLVLFAIRLPVTYQHGRYAMPMMPLYLLLGYMGMLSSMKRIPAKMIDRISSQVWRITTILVIVIFYGLGLQAYVKDVAVIESEMVTVAHWVSQNTDPNTVIAAHDIGALGYFGHRDILDLAGLVSSDVIPFIRDETQLDKFLDQQGVEYLVTFPSWYPELVARASPIFRPTSSYSLDAGGENMVVYQWPGP